MGVLENRKTRLKIKKLSNEIKVYKGAISALNKKIEMIEKSLRGK